MSIGEDDLLSAEAFRANVTYGDIRSCMAYSGKILSTHCFETSLRDLPPVLSPDLVVAALREDTFFAYALGVETPKVDGEAGTIKTTVTYLEYEQPTTTITRAAKLEFTDSIDRYNSNGQTEGQTEFADGWSNGEELEKLDWDMISRILVNQALESELERESSERAVNAAMTSLALAVEIDPQLLDDLFSGENSLSDAVRGFHRCTQRLFERLGGDQIYLNWRELYDESEYWMRIETFGDNGEYAFLLASNHYDEPTETTFFICKPEGLEFPEFLDPDDTMGQLPEEQIALMQDVAIRMCIADPTEPEDVPEYLHSDQTNI